jgi:hypothetical protein
MVRVVNTDHANTDQSKGFVITSHSSSKLYMSSHLDFDFCIFVAFFELVFKIYT